MSASKTVFVTPQIPLAYVNGGIGTFTGHFIRLLREAGEEIQVIFTEPPHTPHNHWKPYYDELGIEVISLYDQPFTVPNGIPPFLKIAEMADEATSSDADVIYYADWKANGMITTRMKRFNPDRTAALVTILHGCSEWHRQGQQLWTGSFDEMVLDYAERYTAQHSDFVVAPSQYVLDWAQRNSWVLPPKDQVQVLGYPFFPPVTKNTQPIEHASHFRRVIFFGRLETRKGFDLFVKALLDLAGTPCLKTVEEIVFLGVSAQHIYGSAETAAHILEDHLGCRVTITSGLDSAEAIQYLADCASDSLVVIPSRSETFGIGIIEASLLPGVNLICSNAGGIGEIFQGQNRELLFEPTLKATTRHLERYLLRGPMRDSQLAHYDWQAANERWLRFHEQTKALGRTRRLERTSHTVSIPTQSKPVDVCIAYYNHGKYLPQTLEALANQSTQNFNVFVVNDGSSESPSIKVFEEMKTRYAAKGWNFVTTPNQGVCAARNHAVSLGKAEYLCFVDSDNIPAPDMVETFYRSILYSQDDCLTCFLYVFVGNRSPVFNKGVGSRIRLVSPAFHSFYPIGNYPAAGLLDNVYGDTNCIIRRKVFEEVGGFSLADCRITSNEDVQLFTKLSLAGYKIDVVPEYLIFYRYLGESRMRQSDNYANDTRLVNLYEHQLQKVGLEDFAPLILGLHYRLRDLQYNFQAQQNAAVPATMPVIPQPTGSADELKYLVHQVRWYTLLRALRMKVAGFPGKLRRKLVSKRFPDIP